MCGRGHGNEKGGYQNGLHNGSANQQCDAGPGCDVKWFGTRQHRRLQRPVTLSSLETSGKGQRDRVGWAEATILRSTVHTADTKRSTPGGDG